MRITYAVCIPLFQESSDHLTRLFAGEGKELQKENHLCDKMLIDQIEKMKGVINAQVLNKEKASILRCWLVSYLLGCTGDPPAEWSGLKTFLIKRAGYGF